MKKQFKYKLRRTLFMYIPMTIVISSIEVLAFIEAGLFII